MLSQFREVITARCRSSSPFTSFSLKFGKLTIKFEMLYKETKNKQFQNFGGETSGCGERGEERRPQLRVSAADPLYCLPSLAIRYTSFIK